MISSSENFNEWLKEEKIDIYSCNFREKGFLMRIYTRVQKGADLTSKQKILLKDLKIKN